MKTTKQFTVIQGDKHMNTNGFNPSASTSESAKTEMNELLSAA